MKVSIIYFFLPFKLHKFELSNSMANILFKESHNLYVEQMLFDVIECYLKKKY